MHDAREEFREIEIAVFARVPAGVAPPLRLPGADEDEDGFTIVRSID